MKLDDAMLSRAAVLVRDKQLSKLPAETECPQHIFSETFEQDMQELIKRVAQGEVHQKKANPGWPYYVRQGIAAVLLCFAITFMAAPDVVIAGYHKLIEVVETIFEEYTEWRYETTGIINSNLEPVTFGYIPETLQQTESSLYEMLYYVFYQGGDNYFCLEQQLLLEESTMTQIVDTENALVSTKQINGEDIVFILKDGIYNYIGVHNQYQISGISNLPEVEIVRILENIQIK